MRKILLWFTRSAFFRWLISDVIPYIRFTVYYTDFRGSKYIEGYRVLTPQHFILAKDSKKLTTFLIGGYWSHAAKCVNKRDKDVIDPVIDNCLVDWEVSEMTHENYTRSHFFDICSEATEVALFRRINETKEQTDLINFNCVSMRRALYDIYFQFGVEALYCSELVYVSIKNMAEKLGLQINFDLSDLIGLGTQYISPDGLMSDPEVICDWHSTGEFTGKMGTEILELLKSRR